MSDFAGALLRDSQRNHFIVFPKCAVDENAIRLFHQGLEMRLRFPPVPGRRKAFFPVFRSSITTPIVSPVVRIFAMRRVGRGFALERISGEAKSFDSRNREFTGISGEPNRVPVHFAVVGKNVEERVSRRQILVHGLGAEDLAGALWIPEASEGRSCDQSARRSERCRESRCRGSRAPVAWRACR